MGKNSTPQETIEIGEDVHSSISHLQHNKWANKIFNHPEGAVVKIIYFDLLFKSCKLCFEAVHTKRVVSKKEFNSIFEEYIVVIETLKNLEAEIKIREFLDSFLKQ